METQKKKSSSGCITAIMALLILACLFLVVGGSLLFLTGQETVGATVCIALGLGALLFFGTGKFLVSHPGNRTATGILIGLVSMIGGGIVAAVLVSMLFSMFLKPLADIEHYRQVWQTPVTVTAVVSDHDSYDDEGDTDYRSYVTYTYNGIRYQNLPYEDKDAEQDLTPLGTALSLQISPKDPARQISDLKSRGQIVSFSTFFVFLSFSGLYLLLLHRGLTKSCPGTPEAETVQKDLQIKILSRIIRPTLLLCWIGYGLLYWRYSIVLGRLPLILAVASGIGWLFCMYTTVRDYRLAKNGSYTLRRDTLVYKEESTDSEGSTSYTLYYRSEERNWQTSVSLKAYTRATVGDTVLAVYLPDKKKPTLHYDRDGNAH